MADSTIKLFFAGDFCSKPTTNYISVSDELKDLIQSCEIRSVNFEVPLKPDNSQEFPLMGNYERFFQNDDVPAFLKNIGFNLFPMANNHAFDWGKEGFEKTRQSLGDGSFGAGTYDEAYNVKIVDVKGLKLGFLAVTYAANYGVFHDVLHHDGYACAYINDLKVNHVILEAKKIVDYLFVLPHDGLEYIDIPLPEIIARYRDFVDYGADAVIGTHPHCPQGWEEYKGKPIFYSLGNFFFNSKEDTLYRAWNRPHWYDGLCVLMELSNGGISYRVINTKNTDNINISVDTSEERNAHNSAICNYLIDESSYRARLSESLEHSIAKQDLSLIDNTVHMNNMYSLLKRVLKKMIKTVLKKDKTDDLPLAFLLKNPTRCSGLLRYIERKD